MHQSIEDKRSLLAEEMLRYFGDTCPTLAARCQAAIVRLPALACREAADRLQDFAAVTKATNLELLAARAAGAGEQTTNEFLFDRALASIEHLSELAEETTRRIDELLSGAPGRN